MSNLEIIINKMWNNRDFLFGILANKEPGKFARSKGFDVTDEEIAILKTSADKVVGCINDQLKAIAVKSQRIVLSDGGKIKIKDTALQQLMAHHTASCTGDGWGHY